MRRSAVRHATRLLLMAALGCSSADDAGSPPPAAVEEQVGSSPGLAEAAASGTGGSQTGDRATAAPAPGDGTAEPAQGDAGGAAPGEPSTPSQAGASGDQDGAGAADAPATAPPETQADACVLAIRLDTCCGVAAAVTPAELAADECLVPWLERRADQALATRCLARSQIDCATVLCASPRPPSRRVARDAAGACAFVSDCEQDADCVRAYEATHCCACPEAWPAAEVAVEVCVVPDGEAPPEDVAEKCAPICPGLCGACQEPTAPQCESEGALRVCR